MSGRRNEPAAEQANTGEANTGAVGTAPVSHPGSQAERGGSQAERRGSRAVRWRVAVRLARRQVRRTWASSLLILALIALPIAGMAGAAVFADSMMGTAEERADVELGQMTAWVQPAGVPGAGLWQAPSEPFWSGYPAEGDGSRPVPEGEIPTDPISALPGGTETVRISSGEVRIDTVAGVTLADAWGGEVWDPRLAGRFDVLEGRAPRGDREVMVSPATLTRAGATIGGTITVEDVDYTVTGTIDFAELPDAEPALAFADGARFDNTKWYLPDLALSWDDVQQLNDRGIVAYSREVVLDPPPFEIDGYPVESPAARALLTRLALVGALAAGGVAAGYMVIMLAGAAFAVSARRQQRALAIAASVGAGSGDLRRVVLLQGTVLGAVAGVVGVGVGIGSAALVQRLIDNGSATMFWGFHVPWEVLAGILLFAAIVGTLSALAPARTVARSDALTALRGARRPQKVTASRPLWGSLMIIVGVGVTVVSGLGAAAVTASDGIPWDSPLRWLPIVGIIGGPILAQLGIVLSGRWLLWLCSLLLSRLGIAARIASRDAVANGARTVPAFAAIGATVFAGVFAVGMVGMVTEQNARGWNYYAPIGTATGTIYAANEEPLTSEQAREAAAATAEMYEQVGVTSTAVVSRQQRFWVENESDLPDDLERAVAVTPERNLLDPEVVDGYSITELNDPQNNISVIAAGDLETVTGVRLDAAQRAAYDAGAALVVDDGLITDGTITVGAWTERDWQFGNAPSNVFTPWKGQEISEPLWTKTVDAVVVDAPNQPVVVAIAPRTASELGIATVPLMVFGGFSAGATTEQQDRLQALSEGLRGDAFGVSVWIETGPMQAYVWLVPLLGAMAVLVIGSSSVALGLARFERRPDDATLSAVGGTAGLRRRIGFWQGIVIVGFGTIAGAVAGVLPPIGFLLQSQADTGRELHLADIPWALLAALVLVLPVAIAAINWLVPPRQPDLTRRTAIA